MYRILLMLHACWTSVCWMIFKCVLIGSDKLVLSGTGMCWILLGGFLIVEQAYICMIWGGFCGK